jgi:hypothetical protein
MRNMACREIAALRLGMMNVIGQSNDHEREHELAELGDAWNEAGPLRLCARATNLGHLQEGYSAALDELERSLATFAVGSKEHAYHLTLVALNRKIELEIADRIASLNRLCRDLDTMHDLVHVLHPNG